MTLAHTPEKSRSCACHLCIKLVLFGLAVSRVPVQYLFYSILEDKASYNTVPNVMWITNHNGYRITLATGQGTTMLLIERTPNASAQLVERTPHLVDECPLAQPHQYGMTARLLVEP
jgi:hypothetical protein